MRYECSFPGCSDATNSHYCTKHRRWCSECGLEWSERELLRGMCRECHRIDFAYAGCESACCVDDNRGNVTVDGVARFT